MSDGKAYISKVTTREKDLYQLNAPSEHNKNEDMHLSWGDAVNDDKLVLSMVLTGSNDSTNYVDVYDFDITSPLSGNYTISKNYFLSRPEINKSFMSGSKITSTISITRYVNLE